MIDELRLAFAALATHGKPEHHGLATLAIDAVDGAYVAIDEQTRPHLLLRTQLHVMIDPGVTTLAVSTRSSATATSILILGRKLTTYSAPR